MKFQCVYKENHKLKKHHLTQYDTMKKCINNNNNDDENNKNGRNHTSHHHDKNIMTLARRNVDNRN